MFSNISLTTLHTYAHMYLRMPWRWVRQLLDFIALPCRAAEASTRCRLRLRPAHDTVYPLSRARRGSQEFARKFVYLLRLRANHRAPIFLASSSSSVQLILVGFLRRFISVPCVTPRYFSRKRRKEGSQVVQENISWIKIHLVLGVASSVGHSSRNKPPRSSLFSVHFSKQISKDDN